MPKLLITTPLSKITQEDEWVTALWKSGYKGVQEWLVSFLKTSDVKSLSDEELEKLQFLLNFSMEHPPTWEYEIGPIRPWTVGQIRFCLTAMKQGVLPWEIYSCKI